MAEQEDSRSPVLPEEEEETYDVFIAHSSSEVELSLEILDKLEQKHDLKCFHSARDFRAGGSIVNNALYGIGKSRKVLLLVSEKFLESDWFIFETQQTLQKGYAKKQKVLIPVLYEIDPEKVPPYVREINYLVWNEVDFWSKLTKAIQETMPLSSAIPAGNVAHGLAWSYFYGFLNLVLPGLKQRVAKSKWATEEEYKESPILPKLLIMLPKSCYCPGNLISLDEECFSFDGHIPYNATRAGNINRDYKSSVYKVRCPDTGKEYFFLGEFATPLLSLYEMEKGQISGLNQEQKQHQMTLFTDKLKEILEHPNNSGCHDKALMMPYNDDPKQLGEHNLARQIVKKIKHDLEKDAEVAKMASLVNAMKT